VRPLPAEPPEPFLVHFRSVKEGIIEIIKWIRESLRPVIVLFILSGLVLFSPRAWVAAIGVEDGVQKYRFVALLVFVGSFIWLATFPIEAGYHRWKKMRYLNHLTAEEKNILKPFIENARKMQAFVANLAVARHLAQFNILKETATTDVHGHKVFAINERVFSHLQENPELIGLDKKSS
jgi:Super-infection exclusion protein B